MMEQNLQTVLFIDDHCADYLKTLTPAAETFGFELYGIDNVLAGLEYLKKYPGNARAVILDYSFPIGETQGIEALQKIKKLETELPVIMLTDSDSATDLDRVVECMKNGAYNYIGKRTLNPVYLFQIVTSATKQAQLVQRLNLTRQISETNYRYHTYVTVSQVAGYSHSAVFGFELVSINGAPTSSDSELSKQKAFNWHKNLLQSISKAYSGEISINIKFICEKHKIKCSIFFTTYATDDGSLKTITDNLQHDICTFFAIDTIEEAHPYIFEEITDSDYLAQINIFSNIYKYIVFSRKPLKIVKKKAIGFGTNPSDDLDNSKNDSEELLPIPSNFRCDNEIFTALSKQDCYTEIDIRLSPVTLLKKEVDIIKGAIDDPFTLDADFLNTTQKIIYVDYLKKFIATTKDKFVSSVILKLSNKDNWEQHLKAGIQNYFFGSDDIFYYKTTGELIRYSTKDTIQSSRIPFIYSVDEAVQLFRLPFPGNADITGLKQQSNKFYTLPYDLAHEGIALGVKKLTNSTRDIKIDETSLARHLYIMGQTGTGKSTMLKTMINNCIDKNLGFTVIDPHGDLFEQVLKLIPKKRKEKVYILDITDPDNSVKLNPLQYDENLPQAKSLVINEMIRVFTSLYDMKVTGGPIFETYFKNGLLLLMDSKVEEKFGKGNLSDMLSLFYDSDYRKKILEICGDKSLREFFKNSEYMSGEQSFANFAPYIVSKLNKLVSDYYLAPILNSENSINFRSLIDSGGILLVRMDKGLIGPDNASLFGQLVLSKLILAGMSRTKTKIEERTQHYIFIDEFQNFLKSDVGAALSEVRKYGLTLILANQTLGQLDNYIIQSLLGNVGSLVFFRPGIQDYELLKYYLEPDFERSDILKLPNFNCISRLLINNIPSDPFVFQTKND